MAAIKSNKEFLNFYAQFKQFKFFKNYVIYFGAFKGYYEIFIELEANNKIYYYYWRLKLTAKLTELARILFQEAYLFNLERFFL